MKIVIFDTGAGGRLFAQFLSDSRPDVDLEIVIDDKNAPYGDKTDAQICNLTEKALSEWIGRVDAIVLACNTATAVSIDYLHQRYPKQVFFGFEPMVKTAANLTKTGKIMVLATDATKKSRRYKSLKDRFPGVVIAEPSCSDWAAKIDGNSLTEKDVRAVLSGDLEGVDVIVLACTHYVAMRGVIQRIAGSGAIVLDPFAAVVRHLTKCLS